MKKIIENKRMFKFIVISLFLLLLIVISTLAFKKIIKNLKVLNTQLKNFQRSKMQFTFLEINGNMYC